MSAPILWIGMPLLVAIFLWTIRKDERRTLIWGLGFSIFFFISSSLVPIGKPLIRIGEFVFQFSPSISFLGRSFTLRNGDLIYTSLIYVILFFFISMAFIIDVPVKFVPLSFFLTGLFIGALSVQPFLYAALLLEICVILSVVLLTSYGKLPSNGVMRFLIFQSIAMPFMLISGWVLSAIEANPTETRLIFQALVLLGLGFSFWLGVFPFNAWMTQISEEKPPFEVGFVLLLFNTATLILIIRYLDGFVWLRDDARIFIVLRFIGILLLASSSLFFFFEKNIYRTTAYLISFETGLSLISLSLNDTGGWNAFVLMILPRIMAISLWSVLLTFIQQLEENNTEKQALSIHPAMIFGFFLSTFSIAGIPVLPAFYSRLSLFESLAKKDFTAMIWVTICILVFLLSSIRFIRKIQKLYSPRIDVQISRTEKLYLYGWNLLFLLIGVFPLPLYKTLLSMLQAFPNLK
ncbi:proton-conducting transporter membrane subunit [Leptolinea tardivitalis]|uniref:NADH:quinone oxidoreductase/Mrp antiporter transmembrane domain-containing protein n=1 Tax=Leptolinea tardivitalis TaxID=229920 RepID=A0A0P6XZY4_9CHLR|nr:proton-conducting transporter membrane subunit [Leptolinea tardivitalis]KPL74755.1 hypothetical protein ADM99_01375 [Leptolinea tardivitalis]GAP22873.1 multisubunit sodium/proton antiporter, MrpD subunit [Leptolinea tardivitalis]